MVYWSMVYWSMVYFSNVFISGLWSTGLWSTVLQTLTAQRSLWRPLLCMAQQEVEAERFLWGRPHKGIPGHYAED